MKKGVRAISGSGATGRVERPPGKSLNQGERLRMESRENLAGAAREEPLLREMMKNQV